MKAEVPLPDPLVVPLLEAAADTLRALESADVPASLRHLHGFDRRGLLHGPGPRQLRRALTEDSAFAARVLETFTALPPVLALLEQWSTGDPVEMVSDSAARHDLPLLASVLWACEPEHAMFGLGLVVERDAHERRERGDEKAAQARDREMGTLDEARRRADAARMEAEAEANRVAEQLRQERTARREREERAESVASEAEQRARATTAELDEMRTAVDDAQARVSREAARGRALERDLARSRAELNAAVARADQISSRLDRRDSDALSDAVKALQQATASLEALRRRVRVDAPDAAPEADAARERPLAKRMQPDVPAGVVGESAAGIEAMLRTKDALLVVDGYNVSKRAWPDATAADQRERLAIVVTGLHRRVGCEVLLVFDGDGTAVPALRRGGVRVVFSDAGEEADEVVVREVAALPKRVPVVVASSDAWVREHAEAEGAVVVGADALLAVLKPAR